MQSIKQSPGAANLTRLLPVFSLLLSATLWGLFWYPLRLLEQGGLSGLWATLLIYLGTLPVLLYLLHGRYAEFRKAPWLLAGLALASGWCNVAFVLAVLDGNIVRVLLLFYLSPFWATLIGWWFLGERIHPGTLVVLALALGGAVIMLWRPQAGLPWPEGHADWLALTSGLSFAVANAFVRTAQACSMQTRTAVSWLGVTLVALLLIAALRVPLGDAQQTVLLAAPLIGMLGISVMTLAVVYGVAHMPIHRSSIILLFEIVIGAVSAQLLTDEVIRPQEWIGGSLVILAAFLSAQRQRKPGEQG